MLRHEYKCLFAYFRFLRGLLFKIVDFLYSRSEVFDTVLKVISSENIFFSIDLMMYKA